MKSIIISLVALFAVAGMASCGEDNDSDVRREARESLNVDNGNALPISPTPGVVPPNPAAAAGVGNHYTCPNNCEGSGGATQVACPVCGTQYVHNAAFHAQAANPAVTPPGATPPGATPPGATPPGTPPAAQNAAGVFHYTCSNGCAGGAGAAGACGTCGSALAHNTAFHNN